MVDPIRVVLDPGHGGKDKGAQENGIVESHWVLAFCQYLQTHLAHTSEPVNVRLSRVSDDYMTLDERADRINGMNPDLVIHVHVNAGGGAEGLHGGLLFHWPENPAGFAIGNAIAAALPPPLKHRKPLKSIAAVNDPLPMHQWLQRPRNVMRRIQGTSVLLEVGYCSNATDAALLQTPAIQAGLVGAVECGIHEARRFFGKA